MNKVGLMGRFTKDLELKYGTSGTAFLGFTLAVNRSFTKAEEEKQSDFIRCKAFGKTAENINSFFVKGNLVIVFGHIQTGSYDKDGQKIYTTEVIVNEFFFSGEKKTKTDGVEYTQTTESGAVIPLTPEQLKQLELEAEIELPF
jgi:single-strand DNA-binding protein